MRDEVQQTDFIPYFLALFVGCRVPQEGVVRGTCYPGARHNRFAGVPRAPFKPKVPVSRGDPGKLIPRVRSTTGPENGPKKVYPQTIHPPRTGVNRKRTKTALFWSFSGPFRSFFGPKMAPSEIALFWAGLPLKTKLPSGSPPSSAPPPPGVDEIGCG